MENRCQNIQERIPELISGALPAEKAAELRHHISRCPACSKYLQGLQADDKLLGDFAEAMQPTVARLENNVIDVLERAPSSKPVSTISIWRTIMKSRITRLATAAAIILIVALGITLLDKCVTPAYGMMDVVEVLRKADTIHILTRQVFDKDLSIEKEKTKYSFEDWIDIKRGQTKTGSFILVPNKCGNDKPKIMQFDRVFDGKYMMEINPARKNIRFIKLSEFQQTLHTRQILERFLKKIYRTSKELSEYIKIGQERIDDKMFDIWQKEHSLNDGQLCRKVICWVSPSSGQLKRLETWRKDKDSEEQWALSTEIEVELNVTPPPGTFETTPPVGYRQLNTKETATKWPLIHRPIALETIEGEVAAVFTLDNSSIIIGWFNKDKGTAGPTDEIFKNLQIGGDLPKLPVEIYGLRLIENWDGANLTFADFTYVGRHLAYTKKGEKLYEWGIYVPEKDVSPGDGLRAYQMLTRLHPEDRQDSLAKWLGQTYIKSFTIGADEFDTFIRGAMAELSDGGVVPEHVTYENVLKLAEDIKASMQK